MLIGRVAFDSTLPVFAAGALDCGKRTFAPDEPFPWREIGLSEFDLLCFWRSGLVYFTQAVPPDEPPKQRKPQRASR